MIGKNLIFFTTLANIKVVHDGIVHGLTERICGVIEKKDGILCFLINVGDKPNVEHCVVFYCKMRRFNAASSVCSPTTWHASDASRNTCTGNNKTTTTIISTTIISTTTTTGSTARAARSTTKRECNSYSCCCC
jgi:hypothetical protein